ncbi:ATP phosphoribosyltransferase regulatory subunit [Alkalispirochaeta americana]|uniref:ATP phosphoribosyltransferase regulatory subunit n=1 Tax=Alkalispirochaeta americana TaxID=159291 RepID=A0A1N6WHY8_9SPIO|nr:ATP phosphoribosyltransferase regulatory subunit [Alkalispirochaeta americana]SIQ89729.1 ATP phosphoribosyltransferase regulatory subunit [Alkalispirochaeta americana]
MSEWSNRRGRHHSLGLPTGTETLQLQEAARHRRITRILEDQFELWGYTPAETPLVDYFDVYQPLLTPEGVRSTYRAMDRQGEILSVRADTTLFLAKQLGLHLSAEELPVRVWYNDQIVRAEEEHDIASNDYQQAGLELVGAPGIEADAEVLLILQDSLKALSLETAAIHLGHHRILEALTPEGITPAALRSLVRRRRPLPAEWGLSADLQELLLFIGCRKSFSRKLQEWTLPGDVRSAAEELLALTDLLPQDASPQENHPRIRIDISELASHDYYSGIAFSAYHPESTAAIARGGRYDHLLGHFGYDAPSVGFSVFTRKLPPRSLREEHRPSPSAPGQTFAERAARAQEAHERGERMHL